MLTLNPKNQSLDFISSKANGQNINDVSPAFIIESIIRQIDKPETVDKLYISVNDHNKRSYSFILDVDSLHDTKLLSILATHGIVVKPWLYSPIVDYLFNEYKRCCDNDLIKYQHSILGWYKVNNKYRYLLDSTYIDDNNTLISTTTRSDFRFSKGNADKYIDFLKKVVYPVPTLALGLAIGYSAVVVSRLRFVYDIGTIIVNLCGASSTGKTTISQLMVSPFGCPIITNKDSLIKTFHSTTNAIFAGIEGIHGLPIVLDDITTNQFVNIPNLIYTLSSGEEKSRCNSEGLVKNDHSGWSGVVIISSETPIQDDSSQNQGLQVRVINTQGITWTPSAKTAELIKRFVQSYYGHTGKTFAKFIEDINIVDLSKQFEEAKSEVHKLMTIRDNLSDRLEIKYTAIYLTMMLMNQCFSLNLNCDDLIKILLEPEQSSVLDRDVSTKALAAVTECIVRDSSKFDHLYEHDFENKQDKLAGGIRYGMCIYKQNQTDVYFLSSQLKEVLEDVGIYEIATVKRKWRDTGITICDKGRVDCKFKKLRCIHLVFKGGLPTLLDFKESKADD